MHRPHGASGVCAERRTRDGADSVPPRHPTAALHRETTGGSLTYLFGPRSRRMSPLTPRNNKQLNRSTHSLTLAPLRTVPLHVAIE